MLLHNTGALTCQKAKCKLRFFSCSVPVYRDDGKLFVFCPHCGEKYHLSGEETQQINYEAS